MRDINRAERLLSLFTSPDSAAGIVGDLSEERGQRGSVWFWRQVLGTVLSLVRGALVESPVNMLLLVLLGFAVSLVLSVGTTSVVIHVSGLGPTSSLGIFLVLIRWSAALIVGATLVAAAPRLGMAACVLLTGIRMLLWLAGTLYLFSIAPDIIWPGRVFSIFSGLVSQVLLLLGGAMIRQRWMRRQPSTAQ
jgi:hypothetical protein